ncbi:MAG: SLBB domain-containing protein [Nitrospirae bacterium]|nr:SLBB domain-containing protein [Nitrospirota bacterium]
MFRSKGLRSHLTIGAVFLTFFCHLLLKNVSAQEISPDKIPPQFQSVVPPGFDMKSLTPEQRKLVESELSKKSRQAPAESKEMSTGGGGAEEIQTGIEFIQEQDEETEAQAVKRFGFDFFRTARKRIIAIENMISKGQRPLVSQKDAVAGFVGPLDMVSSHTNATIPPNYMLSPGDRVTIYYWGDLIELTEVKLSLDEKGGVSVPRAGRIVARGMTISQFQDAVKEQLQRVYGKNLSLIASLESLRSIQIFITGEAFRPGSYAVSSVTTLFNALYAGGGPSNFGSLRDIKLIRNNKTVNVDFYNYLLKGDSKDDYPLIAGDTIFISKAGKQVSIAGEVNRPGIYELKEGERLKEIISLGNGIKPTGMLSNVQIRSVIPNKERVVVDLDISKGAVSSNYELFDGDSVVVAAVSPDARNIVTIKGSVERPGVYELKKNMKVSDLFSDTNKPLGGAYMERADILRLNEDKKTTSLITVNLGKALSKEPSDDIRLAPLDELTVYAKWDISFFPPQYVTISGAVQSPGNYYRSDGMTIKDLLVMAGGVLPNTFLDSADLLRYDFEKETYANLSVDLKRVLEGQEAEPYVLKDRDTLRIYSLQDLEFTAPHEVSIAGAVQRPGTYTRFEGMRLSDLLRLSGGVLPGSYEMIEVAKARNEGEVKIIKVNLAALANGDEGQDLLLSDSDIIMVRMKSEFYDRPAWITIGGEVKYPGVYPLKGKEDKIRDLIERAGGLTKYAYAKGTVFTRKKENFPSDEQRRDLLLANNLTNNLNELEYYRQLARNQWLLGKDVKDKDKFQPVGGTAAPVVATSGTPSEAAAIGLAPGVAQSAGQVAGGIMETFERAPAVVSRSRRLGEADLNQSERVILNLERALKGGEDNIILMDGDTITIPQRVETVSIVGAVTRPTSVQYRADSKLDYYIDKSGGFSVDADKKGVKVMRVDGSIIPADKVKYLTEGDIVYVPARVMSLDIVERIDKIIDVVKYTLVTTASVVVFVTLIGLF